MEIHPRFPPSLSCSFELQRYDGNRDRYLIEYTDVRGIKGATWVEHKRLQHCECAERLDGVWKQAYLLVWGDDGGMLSQPSA